MPSVYQLKSRFQNILRPFVIALAGKKITANQVTIVACFLSVAIGMAFLFGKVERSCFLIIPIFLFFRMALNAIDGMLAREHNMASKVGAILNELTDVISDIFLYYPLAFLWGVNVHINVCFISLAILTEMTGVIGVQTGATRRYDGPLGKSDRAFVFSILSLVYAFGVEISPWISWVFAAMIILELLTMLNRANGALKEIK